MKKFTLLFALLLSAVSLQAQKYALIDMDYILENIPAFERANEQLNQTSKAWQAEVEALNNQAQTLYKNYQNESVFLSEGQKKEKENAIVEKEKEASELKKILRPRRRTFQKASKPYRTDSRRDLQRCQGDCLFQRLPAYP